MREGRPVSRVTAVVPDPRRPGTVRIEIDKAPFGALPVEVAAAAGAVVGAVLDEAALARLHAAADAEAALRSVLRALGQRAYARADLARRLVRRGHPRPAVETALDRVTASGLLDDGAFARWYVETRAARGRGPGRLVRDLIALGVARPLIDAAIAAQWPEGSDRETPRRLAERRAAQLGELPAQVKRRRLLAFLARRGYAGAEAVDAVRHTLAVEARRSA